MRAPSTLVASATWTPSTVCPSGGAATTGELSWAGVGQLAPATDEVDRVLELAAADEPVGQPIWMRSEPEVVEGVTPDPRQAGAVPWVHRSGVDALPEDASRIRGVIVRALRNRVADLDDELAEPRRRHGESRSRGDAIHGDRGAVRRGNWHASVDVGRSDGNSR